MPHFVCDKCHAIDNTAVTNYWSAVVDEQPLLCSKCDPTINLPPSYEACSEGHSLEWYVDNTFLLFINAPASPQDLLGKLDVQLTLHVNDCTPVALEEWLAMRRKFLTSTRKVANARKVSTALLSVAALGSAIIGNDSRLHAPVRMVQDPMQALGRLEAAKLKRLNRMRKRQGAKTL